MSHLLDETDRKILDLLQRDARKTNAAIAAEVGLTAPSVFERIRKLEQRGVIRGYRVDVDPAALGRPLTAFIRLTVASDEKNEAGIRAIRRDPDVLECYHVAGEDCYILKTQASDPGELEALLARLRKQMNIQRSVTMIALSVIKEGAPLNTLSPTSASALPANHTSSRKRK